jgi:hypothetical protein
VAELTGFWSYVHKDDETEAGRISRLARDVVAQYELLTGESIELFLDQDAIEWGENWRGKIDASLASVAFFIPVLTPRYFLSSECRRELQSFARRATALGIKELVLPLVYVDVSVLHDESPTDGLATLVNTFQREDWTELRFAEPHSEGYRRGVANLAERLVNANAQAARANVAEAVAELEATPVEEETEPLGWMDRVGKAETTMPEWNETLISIKQEIEAIGELLGEATEDIQRGEAQGKGIAARLTIARQVAQKMAEPAERIFTLGNQFASQLHDVDEGLRILIERASSEIANDPSNEQRVCEFFGTMRQLSAATHEGIGGAQTLIEAVAPLEAASRDLRRPFRRLREGLTLMLEAREVADEWVRLMDDSGVECGESS